MRAGGAGESRGPARDVPWPWRGTAARLPEERRWGMGLISKPESRPSHRPRVLQVPEALFSPAPSSANWREHKGMGTSQSPQWDRAVSPCCQTSPRPRCPEAPLLLCAEAEAPQELLEVVLLRTGPRVQLHAAAPAAAEQQSRRARGSLGPAWALGLDAYIT